MKNQGTHLTDVLAGLDAGIFNDKINRALSETALGVVTTGKVGQVTITFDLKQIDTSSQVSVKHKIKFTKPTGNGKVIEENTTATPMHVGTGGKLTMYPENQEKLFDEEASR